MHEAAFVKRFEAVWGLERKGFDASAQELGMFAQSNLLGGLGFFAGRVQTKTSEGSGSSGINGISGGASASQSFPMALFSATPSRSFFPRGFAWDEGFHQLLLQKWDAPLAADALAHWLGTLHGHQSSSSTGGSLGGGSGEKGGSVGGSVGGSGGVGACPGGWLPREQVLGEAATRRVPPEFLAQDVAVGNPPTLLLLLDALVTTATATGAATAAAAAAAAATQPTASGGEAAAAAAMRTWLAADLVPALFPRAAAWLDWMLDSQANRQANSDGMAASNAERTFRWRGRNPAEAKLMPTTFASGLDDYPRALFPSDAESHLDLLCWLAHGASLLARTASVLRDQATARAEPPNAAADRNAEAGSNAEVPAAAGAVVALPGSVAYYEGARVKYASTFADLQRSLGRAHWFPDDQAYFDIGLTYNMPLAEVTTATDAVATLGRDVVVSCVNPTTGVQKQVSVAYDYTPSDRSRQRDRQERKGCPRSHPQFQWPLAGSGENGLMMASAVVPPKSTGSAAATAAAIQPAKHVGYVTLFPLLLTLLGPAEEAQLNALLDRMLDSAQLWSPYGLRSLSAGDLFYRQANAPGDEPYWRGAVWMPINFLALRALQHYATPLQLPNAETGQFSAATRRRCAEAYAALRANLLRLVLGQWQSAGSIWEHYDDVSGLGLRSHPFTGWTALVLNVMAEEYAS
jgi:mannosyl-oligosaccharide glucosidase